MDDESVTIYIDQANGKYGFAGDIDGEKLTATINGNVIAIKDEGALGLDKAYTLNLKDLVEKFPDTNIGEMVGMSSKDYKEYKEQFQGILEQYNGLIKEGKITANSAVNILLGSFSPKVTTENVKVDGKEIKCVVTTYTIDAKSLEKGLKAMADEYAKRLNLEGDMRDEFDDMIEEAIEEISGVDFEAKIKLCLNAKTNSIALIEIDAEVQGMAMNASISVSDKAITIEGEMNMNGQKASAEIKLAKKAEKSETTYTLTGEATMGNATIKFLNAEIKSTKDKLTLEVKECNELDIPAISFSAKLTTGKSVKIQPTSIKIDGQKMPVDDMTITFTPGAKVPEIKGEDILKLSEKELEKLIGKLERLF
jgi:hypothetical protein